MSEELRLRAGASARLESSDVTVVFERVESDSRCPKGVTCVWEGDAVVRISVGPKSDSRTELSLHTHRDAAQQGEAAGFLLKLAALDPYPVADSRIDPAQYSIRLVVTPVPR